MSDNFRPFAVTLDPGTSLANLTGTWRTARPVYVDRLPPCNGTCPAGENIQQWLFHAEEGDYAAAWAALVEDNPMPAVMGRVCYHPCEGACNRGRLDTAVSIHAVERFLGDYAITTVTVEKMVIDEDGRPQPTGEFETLEADTLMLALGQEADTRFLEQVTGVAVARDGVVTVDEQMMIGRPGLFAGGDMVPSERTVTVAVGHGKKAARNIDTWLRGGHYAALPENEPGTFENLNTWYYNDAPQTMQAELDLVHRQTSFDEVLRGLTEQNALFEARRCLSCGNCFECDNCYGICPDNAVIKLGPGKRFRFDYSPCKGCGICAAECPCGAIKMQPER